MVDKRSGCCSSSTARTPRYNPFTLQHTATVCGPQPEPGISPSRPPNKHTIGHKSIRYLDQIVHGLILNSRMAYMSTGIYDTVPVPFYLIPYGYRYHSLRGEQKHSSLLGLVLFIQEQSREQSAIIIFNMVQPHLMMACWPRAARPTPWPPSAVAEPTSARHHGARSPRKMRG